MSSFFSLKTRDGLRKLQDQHLKNLPSRNALTYLDTQILCYSLIANIFFTMIFFQLFINESGGVSYSIIIFVHFCVHNIWLSFLFPLYIIMKTRRYLPRLWDDNAPIILQNNDFYAVRLSQVSPGGERNMDTAESSL